MLFALKKSVEIEHREGQTEVEQRIGGGRLANQRDADGASQQDAGSKTCALTEIATAKQHQRQRPEAGSQRRGETKGKLIQTEQGDTSRLQPVDQDRLVVAWHPVEVGGEEIPPLEHLAGRLAEGPLVEIEQRHRMQVEKKADQQSQQPKQQ